MAVYVEFLFTRTEPEMIRRGSGLNVGTNISMNRQLDCKDGPAADEDGS